MDQQAVLIYLCIYVYEYVYHINKEKENISLRGNGDTCVGMDGRETGGVGVRKENGNRIRF